MNKKLLMSLALASAGSFIAPQAWADVTQAQLEAMSDVATFRMQGTEGQEIKLTLAKIYSYTPTVTGDVTFIYNKGVVSVYEGLTKKAVLSGTDADYTFEEPTADDAKVGGKQLLQNASFETYGDQIADGKYKFGAPWSSNVTPGAWGIRIGNSDKAAEGNYVLVWRGSGNANYISQKIEVAANKVYKVVCRQVDSGNANATFNVGIGTEAGKIDIANSTVRLGTSIDNPSSQSAIISTYGATIDGDTYFTLSNTSTNTASSGSDPVTQLDYISLVEGVLANAFSLNGATEATLDDGVDATRDIEIEANKPYVEAYNKMKETYALDASSELDGLTWDKPLGTKSGQYWDGNGATTYFDVWSASASNNVTSTSVVLPKGKYALVCAARASAENIASMKVGDKSVVFPKTGDVGMGITTDGEASFDNQKTYNNNNQGRGWQYIFVEFESDGSTPTAINFDVHLQASTWISYCDVKLYAEKDIAIIKASLESLIETATAASASEGGTKAFFKDNTALDAAIDDANTAKESSVYATIETALNNLNTAYEAFKTAALIAPDENQAYKLILANTNEANWDHSNKAVTTLNNRDGQGGYNIKYLATSDNNNYATAFFFVPAGSGYKLMFVDAEGSNRYICTGVTYGGNTGQIRTTPDADKALVVEVQREGENLRLWNTEAKQYIGSQDDGFFTIYRNINFNFEETTAANEIKYTMAAEYGTLMLPYAVTEIPAGLKVYSCETTTDAKLNTVAVEKIEANVPYLVKGTAGETYSFSGVNTAYKPSYNAGVFTGVFVATTVPTGSYVLQNNDGKLAFYKVDSEITLNANHCYLTATATAGVKAFFFDGDATGIESVEAADATVNVYSVNGTLVRANVKASEALNGLAAGVYVVNGEKKMVK